MSYEAWYERALPILELLSEREGQDFISVRVFAEHIGVDADQTYVELQRLIEGEYIEAAQWLKAAGGRESWSLMEPRLGVPGARAIGRYPPAQDPYELFLAMIDQRIAQETDEAETSRLRKLRRHMTDLGKGVIASLLVEYSKVAA